MERQVFEEILKRSLELQSLQNSPSTDPFSEEDLRSAATRLGIGPEVLEKAIRDVERHQRRFHLTGSPDEVREAFLKHFLMQETALGNPNGQAGAVLQIDRSTVQIGSQTSVRVSHRHLPEVDANIRFTADKAGGTVVTWTAHSQLSWRTKILAGGFPLVIWLVPLIGLLVKGLALTPMLPFLLVMVFTAWLMLWSMRKLAGNLEEVLVTYFENVQMLQDLETQRLMKQELADLRSRDMPPAASSQTPLPGESPGVRFPDQEEEDPEVRRRPPQEDIRQ